MFNQLKIKILASIKSKKINVFLLFVLLSFIVLLFIKLSNTFTTTISFKINKVQVPENHLVLNNKAQQLQITLRTHGFNLLKYYLKEPEIYINFSDNIFQTDSLYVWNKNQGYSELNSQFPKDEEIVSITPDTIKFRYDMNTVKRVPVSLRSHVKFAKGYDLLDVLQLNPDSIKIIGPDVLVSKISLIQTDSLILEDINTNIHKTVALKLPKDDNNNLKFSTNKITVSGQVEKFTEGHLKVPVSVINIPKNVTIKYFPKKVYVTYYTSLSNYSHIQANDFKIVCDYKDVENGKEYLIPEIKKQPKMIKHVKLSHEHIEFIIIE